MVPGSLTRHTSTFSLWSNPRPQKLRRTPPPVWVPDRQAGTSILAPSSRCHRGNTNGMLPPRNPFSPQQHWYQPRTIHQSISSPKTLLLSSQGAGSPISDIHSAHMLTSDSFVKYQCICCPGDVPQNIMHHTYKSFTLFVCVFYCFFFLLFFVCVVSPSQSKKKTNKQKKTSSPSMILSSCCNRQPSERPSPKRGPGGTGFQYGAKRHALAGTHSHDSALGQFNRETGRETAFVFFSFFSSQTLPLRCVAWLELCPALDVPLHVKSQMVRPGETSVTVTAFKWLCPSVLPEVSGQLVAPCKTPLAALP